MPKIPSSQPTVRHIIPISGKDSLATAIVQQARQPDLPYEYLFLDVGMELPETYAWLEKVEKYLGVTLIRCGRSLEEVMADLGMLPSHNRRFCTKYGKLYPLFEFSERCPTIQYIGIRADEDRPPLSSNNHNVTSIYPLKEVGINLPMVYTILTARGLLPPDFFWQRLYDAVYDQVGMVSKTFIQNLKPWSRAALFSWRSRSNCYMCFYQRLYEWVGLLEHHPDLFTKAEELERRFGGCASDPLAGGKRRSLEDFTWRSDGPLDMVRQRADSIFQKRVSQVRKAVIALRHRPEDEEFDLLSLTSCGTFCGK